MESHRSRPWDLSRNARELHNHFKLSLLKGLLKLAEEVALRSVCKGPSNRNPAAMHCFACTFEDIRSRIKRAVEFWEKDDLYKDALS
jgi:hypothetical protein